MKNLCWHGMKEFSLIVFIAMQTTYYLHAILETHSSRLIDYDGENINARFVGAEIPHQGCCAASLEMWNQFFPIRGTNLGGSMHPWSEWARCLGVERSLN